MAIVAAFQMRLRHLNVFLWRALLEQVTAPLAEKNVPEKEKNPQKKPTPPPHSLLYPKAYSKGTATNLPEKESSAFLSMLLNEALMLLWL